MPYQPTPAEELRLIAEYLFQLKVLMAAVVRRPYRIIPGRHHELLRAAWPTVQHQFDEAFKKLDQSGGTSNLHGSFVKAGLTGMPLQFEFALFAEARARLLDHAPEFLVGLELGAPNNVFPPLPADAENEILTKSKRRGFFPKLGRLLFRCFKTADVLLGCFPKLLLGTETIKQFKEGLEEGIELTKEARRK